MGEFFFRQKKSPSSSRKSISVLANLPQFANKPPQFPLDRGMGRWGDGGGAMG